MNINDIESVGWLHNHNGTVCLVICTGVGHVFVTISWDEYHSSDGIEGINRNRQLAINFFEKYGAGRP